MSIKEAYVTVNTIDSTRRSYSFDDDFNVVGVINSPTGPYEETLVTGTKDLIDKYLIGDAVSSTDDTTIIHAAKLLQTMPLRLIRATSSKVLAGINNNGDVIYTDLNYKPFRVSNTVRLSDVTGVGCAPYLGIEYKSGSSTSKVLFTITEDESETGFHYSDEDEAKFTQFGGTRISLTPAAGVSKWGMKNFLKEVIKHSAYVNIPNLAIVNSDSNHIIYCGEDTEIKLYPTWIASESESDLSSDVTKVAFKNYSPISSQLTGKVTASDYITINGYSFYEQTSESSTNVVYPGVSVPLKVEEYTGFAEFGLLVLDKILTNPSTYATPVVINSSVTSTLSATDGSKVKAGGSAARHFSFTPDVTADGSTGATEVVITSVQKDSKVIESYEYLTISVGSEKATFCACGLPANDDDLGTVFLVSSSPITPSKFLVEVVKLLNKIRTGTYSYKGEVLPAWDLDEVVTAVGELSFVGLNSRFRSASAYISKLEYQECIRVTSPIEGFSRTVFSSDNENFSTIKHAFAVKVDKYVFYNYQYASSDFSEVVIKLSDNKLSQSEFLDLLYSQLPSYYTIIFNRLQFTIFYNTDESPVVNYYVDGISQDATVTKKNFDYELSARFGIISKYSSTASNCSFKISKASVDTYTISLGRKADIKDYEVSFIPGTLNGYGVDIYYSFINSLDQISFYLIDLNKNAPIEVLDETYSFGNEIIPKNPNVADYNASIDKILLETGVYYDFITTLGFDNAAYMKHLESIAREKYIQVMCSIPPSILSKEEMKLFRNNTGVDNYQFWMGAPYCTDATVGEFTTEISPAILALERVYSNKLAGNEFAPMFHKTHGRLSASGVNGSALKVKFDKKIDREDLLGSQINCVRYDNRDELYYLNDQLTMQLIDSDLSDWNNVRMVNILAHIADRTMDGFIAEFNNTETRSRVTEVVSDAIKTRMIANQQYSFNDINVICDNTNNTLAIIKERKIALDIEVRFYNGIKYVHVYNRILPLTSVS